MSITAIGQINGVNNPSLVTENADSPISLSSRVAAQQAGSAPNDGPNVAPIFDKDMEDIYQWLLANKITMGEDPQTMISQLIKKIQSITNDDGSKMYLSLDEISGFCTMLKDKCEVNGFTDEKFFNALTGTMFGLNLMYQNIKNTTFFNPNEFYTSDEPMY